MVLISCGVTGPGACRLKGGDCHGVECGDHVDGLEAPVVRYHGARVKTALMPSASGPAVACQQSVRVFMACERPRDRVYGLFCRLRAWLSTLNIFVCLIAT